MNWAWVEVANKMSLTGNTYRNNSLQTDNKIKGMSEPMNKHKPKNFLYETTIKVSIKIIRMTTSISIKYRSSKKSDLYLN